MSIFSLSAFSQQPVNTLPDTGYVGVGTTNPNCNFHVIGTSQISGNVTVDSSITISDSARVDNNLRVNGNLYVAKNAYINDTTFSNVLRVHRITPKPGDSLVYIGDSSITISSYNTIAASPTTYFNTYYGGMGIGTAARGYAFQSLALGRFSFTNGNYSITLGNYTETSSNAPQAITIGSGVSINNKFINTIPNSIMLGTNSNLPTLFISPANGINTTGRVGIGTFNPQAKLQINAVTNDKVLSIFNMLYTNNNCNGEDVFRVWGNGKVEARSVEIKVVSWCDYVFRDDYKLLPLTELEKFIEENGNLPEIPKEEEVKKNGINLGEMNTLLLKKVEELTLYLIEQENRIKELEQCIKK